MLKITIVDGALFFKGLDEEMVEVVEAVIGEPLKFSKQGHTITGTKSALFDCLLSLARVYDIDLI